MKLAKNKIMEYLFDKMENSEKVSAIKNDIHVEENISKEGKKRLELDGKTWIQNSISVWSDIRKTADESALGHPAMFPEMLASRLISCFSYTGDLVFDPFAGTGSTVLAARKMGRKSVGIELSKEFVKLFKARLSIPDMFGNNGVVYEPEMFNDDSNELGKYLKPSSVDLTVTSPPYWDILNQKRSADNKESKNYGNSKKDLGNIHSYNDFLSSLQSIFEKVYTATKPGGYCCVNVMDLRKKSKFYPYHMDVTYFMEEIGFELDDIIIWDRKQEYNNLRPLGHPYVFRVNKVHEFILIFKKHED